MIIVEASLAHVPHLVEGDALRLVETIMRQLVDIIVLNNSIAFARVRALLLIRINKTGIGLTL